MCTVSKIRINNPANTAIWCVFSVYSRKIHWIYRRYDFIYKGSINSFESIELVASLQCGLTNVVHHLVCWTIFKLEFLIFSTCRLNRHGRWCHWPSIYRERSTNQIQISLRRLPIAKWERHLIFNRQAQPHIQLHRSSIYRMAVHYPQFVAIYPLRNRMAGNALHFNLIYRIHVCVMAHIHYSLTNLDAIGPSK